MPPMLTLVPARCIVRRKMASLATVWSPATTLTWHVDPSALYRTSASFAFMNTALPPPPPSYPKGSEDTADTRDAATSARPKDTPLGITGKGRYLGVTAPAAAMVAEC